MDLDTIGAALKRKLGPLPVWIWAIFGGMVVYFLRKKGYFGGGLQTGETLQPRQDAATPREPVTTLQPGESVYDPNSGSLTTAPGSDTGNTGDSSPSSSGGDAGDIGGALDKLADSINNALTDREQPGGGTPTKHKPSALSRAKAAVKRGKVGKENTKRLKAAGYTQSQIDFHARRRTALGKPGHQQPHHKDATTQKTTRTTKPRSDAHTKPANGGRTNGHAKPQGHRGKGPGARNPTATTNTPTRQRPTIPMTRPAAPVHHPTGTHGAKPHQQEHKATPAPPRASAPPPRTQREAPKPKPKPKPRHH